MDVELGFKLGADKVPSGDLPKPEMSEKEAEDKIKKAAEEYKKKMDLHFLGAG